MDKQVNGNIYTEAKFLRTTCKQCGNDLSHGKIMSGWKFCNKECRRKFCSRTKSFKSRLTGKKIYYR